jgi:DNA-binding GntR family transcriptional regulator
MLSESKTSEEQTQTTAPLWEFAPTSEQIVADAIRHEVLEGALPRGIFLSQRKLAELTKSSVSSVRTALRQLENEGLIENVPRLGVRIPEETPSAVRDRYTVRSALECAAVEQLHDNLSTDQRRDLLNQARKLDQISKHRETDQFREFARLHHQFHLHIADLTGNALLLSLLKRVMNSSLMLLNARRSWSNTADRLQNHTSLARAITGNDLETARQSIREHIEVGLRSELDSL